MSGARNGMLNRALLGWFDAHRRELAFRRTRDPYAVLVAEVMLQQTQVGRVEPAWRDFLERFPTIASLACARPAEVLRAWAGLGYYGRAVRLWRAAAAIVERHGGQLPPDVVALEALPGIGPYTARAVAAIAFGRPVAALDTNVGRVVRRVAGLDGAADPAAVGEVRQKADSRAHIQRLADAVVDRARAADWTHAMMDLGATICRPREPRCGECPLRPFCASAGTNGSGIPRRAANAPTPFRATRRWLRGRVVARLRDESDGRWVRFEGAIGEHSPAAVEEALRRLAAEGIVERDRAGRARLAGDAGPAA